MAFYDLTPDERDRKRVTSIARMHDDDPRSWEQVFIDLFDSNPAWYFKKPHTAPRSSDAAWNIGTEVMIRNGVEQK